MGMAALNNIDAVINGKSAPSLVKASVEAKPMEEIKAFN